MLLFIKRFTLYQLTEIGSHHIFFSLDFQQGNFFINLKIKRIKKQRFKKNFFLPLLTDTWDAVLIMEV
jgi:hypothetical protein